MEIIRSNKLPIVKQIVRNISMEIDKGVYGNGFRLLSINDFSDQYAVARDTVERAYKELKRQGYIASSVGKGYFVVGKKEEKLKALFVFDKISSYKKNIYYSFVDTLGDQAKVDIQVHHYRTALFKEIIEQNLGMYHYYVIMPHFLHSADPAEYTEIIQKIPVSQLMLLDKNLAGFNHHMSVFQDFRQDIFDALDSGKVWLKMYNNITFVFSESTQQPREILEGTQGFCRRNNMSFLTIDNVENVKLTKRAVYILISEDDLAFIIKLVRKSPYILGRDIGIISFNETVFKELMDITVVTTDFHLMGQSAANLILGRNYNQIKNPFKMIKRNSL